MKTKTKTEAKAKPAEEKLDISLPFDEFVIQASQGVTGITEGLREAKDTMEEKDIKEVVVALGVRGQELWSLYSLWSSGGCWCRRQSSFADYIVQRYSYKAY